MTLFVYTDSSTNLFPTYPLQNSVTLCHPMNSDICSMCTLACLQLKQTTVDVIKAVSYFWSSRIIFQSVLSYGLIFNNLLTLQSFYKRGHLLTSQPLCGRRVHVVGVPAHTGQSASLRVHSDKHLRISPLHGQTGCPRTALLGTLPGTMFQVPLVSFLDPNWLIVLSGPFPQPKNRIF